MRERIRTGDTVYHRPTGETWLVAYVDGDRLAWCGWPPGTADLADCDLIETADDLESRALIDHMAVMPSADHRHEWARAFLAREEAKS